MVHTRFIARGGVGGEGGPKLDVVDPLVHGTGRKRWSFTCKASHQSEPPVPDDIRMADLDRDGIPEIIVAANWIHVLRPDGSLRWEDYWRYQRGRYVGDVQSIDLADINGDGRTDIVCGIRLNYSVALVYDADGTRLYPEVPQPQPDHRPLRVDPPNDLLTLDLFADGGPPQIVVAATSHLNIRWVGGALDTRRAADLSGGRVALAAVRPAPGERPLLITATDLGAVFAYRAEGRRGAKPSITLKSEWVKLVGGKITALETIVGPRGPEIWVGTQSGRVHVIAADSGRLLGVSAGGRGAVAGLLASEDHILIVRADGSVDEVRSTAMVEREPGL